MKLRKNNVIPISIGYLLVGFVLMLGGIFIGNKLLEFFGFMLFAGTFLPFPADTYILHLPLYFTPLFIAIIGGLVNTIAVLFERYFALVLLKTKKGSKIKKTFNESKFSRYSNRYPFVTLFIAAFSFIPFEPFRFWAITNKYDLKKYAMATFFGRGIRYYVLALIGNIFAKFDLLTYVLILSFTVYLIGLFKRRKKNRKI